MNALDTIDIKKITFTLSLFILQPLYPMPPHEITYEGSESYILACFISFSIGAILYALITKYCTQIKTTKPATPAPAEVKKDQKLSIDILLTQITALRTEHKRISDTVIEQKKTINHFIANNKFMMLLFCAFLSQTCLAIAKNVLPYMQR